jgi:hypothetical protein
VGVGVGVGGVGHLLQLGFKTCGLERLT